MEVNHKATKISCANNYIIVTLPSQKDPVESDTKIYWPFNPDTVQQPHCNPLSSETFLSELLFGTFLTQANMFARSSVAILIIIIESCGDIAKIFYTGCLRFSRPISSQKIGHKNSTNIADSSETIP